MRTADAYAREVRRGALWLAVLALVLVCAAASLVTWHHARIAHEAAVTLGPPAAGLFPGDPGRLFLTLAALLGVGGIAAHGLIRRIGIAAEGQRAVEQALREAEAGHVQAQAIARLGHWSYDIATGTAARSAETYRILGRTPETLGSSIDDFTEVVHPDDRAMFRAMYREAIQRREPVEWEFRVVWPDGTVRHVLSQREVEVNPRTDAPVRLVGTLLDITDRKRAEEALRASELRFRKIFDHAPFGITMGDLEGRVIEVNDAFARFTGYAPAELKGRRFEELCHPDDLARYRAHVGKLASGQTGAIDRRYVRKDGEAVWGRLSLGLIPESGGRPAYGIGIVEDIDERRAMEETLQEREALLRQVTETIDQVFWLKDARTHRVLYVSRAYEAVHGRSVESLYASPNGWLEAVHPEDRERVVAVLARARGTGTAYSAQYRIIRPDGTEREIHGHGYPVRDSNGHVFRWAGVAADVTELHRLQSALKESEDRVRQITETIGEVFWMEDAGMEQTFYISPSYERVWGRTCKSLYENPLSWADAVHPDDRGQVAAGVRRAREAGVSYELTYRIVRPDGTERMIRARGYPVRDETGAVKRWAGVSADVTEVHRLESALEANEERTRLILDSTAEGIYEVDLDGRCTFANAACLRLLGYERAEDLLGRNMHEVLRRGLPHGGHDGHDGCRVQHAILHERELHVTDDHVLRADGTVLPVEFWSHPVYRDGRLVGGVMTFVDATGRYRAEEDRRRYQEELAHVTRLATMGEMASGLAHEINQPLTAIANYAQGSIRRLLAEGRAPEDGLTQSLEQIARQAARAGEIVRHLRELVGKGHGLRTVEDINALIASAARLMQPEARRHGVRLRLEPGQGLPPVEVDRIQVDQVLINLVKNAIEALAAHPGPREVVLRSEDGDPAGAVRISVADTGPGLPPREPERLFGAFVTTKPDGLGMGLAISRSIVEAHGGTLTAAAGPDGGAVFRFTVPASREVAVG